MLFKTSIFSLCVTVTCCWKLHIQYILMHFSLTSWDIFAVLLVQKTISSCALYLLRAGAQLGFWVPGVKSALISNNQGEVPLPRQSQATSHMFLTHRPALHHLLIIATTRGITLERQRAVALGAEAKTAKLCIRTFFKRQGVSSKIAERFQIDVKGLNTHQMSLISSVATFVVFPNGLQNYWSPQFCWLEPSRYIIGLSAVSLYPAVMNGRALVLPHQETGFPVALSINAL